MEQGTSWEADSVSASQEIHRMLLNQNAHYSVHNSLPLVPRLSRMNPAHDLRIDLRSIFNIILSRKPASC
jgi:hypothetical protein